MADVRRDSRSRSPPRMAAKSSGGIRWKEKRPREADSNDDRDRRDRGLERGYRNRSPRRDWDRPGRDSYGDRDRYRARDQDRDGYGDRRDRDRDYNRDRNGDRDREAGRDRARRDEDRNHDQSRDREMKRERERERERDHGGDSARGTPSTATKDRDPDRKPPKKEKKPAAAAPPKPKTNEEMIIVTVNDRLGSKTQVPCLGSDTIGQFKVMVAMRIGREPHEIMLKRQGERPFKNHITVADYGISNGVQLDLEVDTGD